MHSIHNIYMVQLHEKKIKCDYYKDKLLQCLNNQSNDTNDTHDTQKNKINKINKMIETYCYNSFSNKDICSSVNNCGVTLK